MNTTTRATAPLPSSSFVAFYVLDGTVLGRCMQNHTYQEFIRFLNAVDAEVPAGELVHTVLDNYATHEHPNVRA